VTYHKKKIPILHNRSETVIPSSLAKTALNSIEIAIQHALNLLFLDVPVEQFELLSLV
jgi:hypothetical protein